MGGKTGVPSNLSSEGTGSQFEDMSSILGMSPAHEVHYYVIM